jgi:hypothetical protein
VVKGAFRLAYVALKTSFKGLLARVLKFRLTLQHWLTRSELNAHAYDVLVSHKIVSYFPAEMAAFMDRITPDELSNEPLGFRECFNALANWSKSQNAQVDRLRRIANS